MSPADVIDAVRLELSEMKKLGALTERSHAAATRYVQSHSDEIVEMAEYSSISDIVDSVMACSTGGCE